MMNMWSYLPKKHRNDLHELWIDLPKHPPVGKDADQCWVDNGTDTLRLLREYFPYPRWVESYQERKWKGHVFCSGDPEVRWAVNRVAKRLLKENYRVRELDRCATDECKIPSISNC